MIYTAIKLLCDKKGMSVTAVEKKAGLTNGLISKWDKSAPQINHLKKVADVLGVKVDTILREADKCTDSKEMITST